jgi:hypothetical protein
MATAFRSILLLATFAASPQGSPPPVPVLVELFTSEGCSSCPPADAVLARLTEREGAVRGAEVIALGEHVDYWDDLGWKDAFSSPIFTHRQEAYVRRLGLGGPYTPQLVVGGEHQVVGSDETGARAAIAAAARTPAGSLTVRIGSRSPDGIAVHVDATWSTGEVGEVVVAVAEDHATSAVTRGENAGRKLRHVAVVREMSVVGRGAGSFSGSAQVALPRTLSPSRVVAFVQEPAGGRVRAVGMVKLER